MEISNSKNLTETNADFSPYTNPHYVEDKLGFNDFNFLKLLCKGVYSKIVLCREKRTGVVYTIKMLEKKSLLENNLMNNKLTEMKMLTNTKHPFLICLKHSFETINWLCFVMEFLNGGDLYFHISENKFNEKRSKFYCSQILLALEYLHEKWILYRDLKLENILIDYDENIKIVDYVLCKENIYYGSKTSKFCGTPEFMAFENIKNLEYGRAID